MAFHSLGGLQYQSSDGVVLPFADSSGFFQGSLEVPNVTQGGSETGHTLKMVWCYLDSSGSYMTTRTGSVFFEDGGVVSPPAALGNDLFAVKIPHNVYYRDWPDYPGVQIAYQNSGVTPATLRCLLFAKDGFIFHPTAYPVGDLVTSADFAFEVTQSELVLSCGDALELTEGIGSTALIVLRTPAPTGGVAVEITGSAVVSPSITSAVIPAGERHVWLPFDVVGAGSGGLTVVAQFPSGSVATASQLGWQASAGIIGLSAAAPSGGYPKAFGPSRECWSSGGAGSGSQIQKVCGPCVNANPDAPEKCATTTYTLTRNGTCVSTLNPTIRCCYYSVKSVQSPKYVKDATLTGIADCSIEAFWFWEDDIEGSQICCYWLRQGTSLTDYAHCATKLSFVEQRTCNGVTMQ